MTVDLSIGEVEGLVLKACRGSGMDWGLAEEAGRAAGWLAAHGLPGLEAFSLFLEGFEPQTHKKRAPCVNENRWSAKNSTLCPVFTGAALSDVSGILEKGRVIGLNNVSFPLILVAFAGLSAGRQGKTFIVEWPGVRVVCDAGPATVEGALQALLAREASRMRMEIGDEHVANPLQTKRRGCCSDEAFAALSKQAFKTYVPATAQSRAKGAGAGLSDND
ncbi:MAG: DUF3726 domain-containing protein [Hyphomicrobiales bacterium]